MNNNKNNKENLIKPKYNKELIKLSKQFKMDVKTIKLLMDNNIIVKKNNKYYLVLDKNYPLDYKP